MTRTLISVQPSVNLQGAGPLAIDNVNGMHCDLSNPAIGALLDRYALHVLISNTAGAGSAIVRAGYGPWAGQAAQGDLTIPIAGASITDIGSQILLARHSRDAFGSFDLDFVTVAGSILVVLSNSAPVPANTAQNAVIKSSPAWLLASIVTTVGTAALSTYDHQGAAAGNVLHTIPGSAPLGSMYTPGARALNGLTLAGLASGPGCIVFYS